MAAEAHEAIKLRETAGLPTTLVKAVRWGEVIRAGQGQQERSFMEAAEAIVAWIVSVGLEGRSQAELTTGYCDRLIEAGVPLWRASIGATRCIP